MCHNTFNGNDHACRMPTASRAPHVSARIRSHPLFGKESCLGRTRLLRSRQLFCAVPLCLTQQQRDYKILNPLNSLKTSNCTPSK